MSFVIPSDPECTPTTRYTSDLTEEDIFKMMRKHPRYKWYYFLAKLRIKWQVFKYKLLVKLFWFLYLSKFEFMQNLSYHKIFNEVWENEDMGF